jgi:4-diphosphocytidyl-2-C-methyl-D-erythritol kinase
VGSVDARGYHPLRTIFQAIGLYDRMTIRRAERTEVTFDSPGVPVENTVTRALSLLSEVIEVPPLAIHVEKHIPTESGLGGGSSNAASVLRAVPRMVGAELPEETLAALASRVGADVAFFLVGGRARGEGYGERLTPIPSVAEWYVVTRPSVSCATGEAYRRLDVKAYDWRDFPAGDELYNDFERVAPCESLDLIERLLVAGAKDAGMTGSGSAVFGRFGNAEAAEKAAERLRTEGYAWVKVAPALESPAFLA